MHIVHVITRFIRGGADENTLITCNHQAASGHTVALVVGREWNPEIRAKLDPRVVMHVVPELRREVSFVADIRATYAMFRMFRKLQPDIVHTHTSKAGICGRLAAFCARVPTIIHSVHILPFTGLGGLTALFYIGLEKLCGRMTDAFIHVSPGMKEECERYKIGRSTPHMVVESGMNITHYRNASAPFDAASLLKSPCGHADRPFAVLSLAVLEPRKRIGLLLPVFRNVVAKRPNTVLLVAGDGPLRSALEAQANALGIGDHVRFLGYRNDAEKLLSIADALVVCSEREGLPRAAVQAGIAGVPVVSTELPGITLTVRPKETGYVVPINDLSGMEHALLELGGSPTIRAEFRERISRMDFSRWDDRTMGTRIEEVYRALAS